MFRKRLIGVVSAVVLMAATVTAPLQAQEVPLDCSPGGAPKKACPIWNVTVAFKWTGIEVTCSTGGEYTCETDDDNI